MAALLQFWNSTIGKKWVMAITGIGLVLFAVGHMAGNLQIFLGVTAFNDYAHKLQSLGPLLWIARIGLFVMAVLHIISAIQLTAIAKAARPADYVKRESQIATLASRTMPSGSLSLCCPQSMACIGCFQSLARVRIARSNSVIDRLTVEGDTPSARRSATSFVSVLSSIVAIIVLMPIRFCSSAR